MPRAGIVVARLGILKCPRQPMGVVVSAYGLPFLAEGQVVPGLVGAASNVGADSGSEAMIGVKEASTGA